MCGVDKVCYENCLKRRKILYKQQKVDRQSNKLNVCVVYLNQPTQQTHADINLTRFTLL